jgi:sulfatase maturation enzyme AslB (radical SAM superfamily)
MNKIPPPRKIICYGAGTQGHNIKNTLQAFGVEISLYCDQNLAGSNIEGIKIISPKELFHLEEKSEIAVIIGIGIHKTNVIEEIDKSLVNNGFKNIYYSAVDMVTDLYPEINIEEIVLPQCITFCTNVGCSVNCKYCPQELLISKYRKLVGEDSFAEKRMMTFEAFTTMCEKLPVFYTIAFGGTTEPFLNSLCSDMMVYASENGHELYLLTTLANMKYKDFEKIKNLHFNTIRLHVADEDGNSNIPITDESLELLILFYKNFEQTITGFNNSFNNCISVHGNIHPRVKAAFKKNGIDTDRIKNPSEILNSRAGNLKIRGDNIITLHSPLSPPIICRYNPLKNPLKTIDMKFTNADELFYLSQFDRFAVYPNGDVSFCCTADYGLKHILGNLLSQSFDEILNKRNIIHEQMKNGGDLICFNCNDAYRIDDMSLIKRKNNIYL